MKTIAQFCYRRRRYVLGAWILLLVGLFVVSTAFAGEFSTEFKLPGSESQARSTCSRRGARPSAAASRARSSSRPSRASTTRPCGRRSRVCSQTSTPTVTDVEVVSPYEPGNEHQIAEGGTIAYAELNFSDRDYEEYIDDADVIKGLRDEVQVEGLQIELGGDMFAERAEFSSEFIGIVAAIIILLIAFGSVMAMGLPIITALFGIGCGVALIGVGRAVHRRCRSSRPRWRR